MAQRELPNFFTGILMPLAFSFFCLESARRNMGEDRCSRGDGMDLLKQLLLILERDHLIDEVGFLHPAQFAALNGDSESSLPSPHGDNQSTDGVTSMDMLAFNEVQYDKAAFWNNNHKLAISTQVLTQLYSATMKTYMDATSHYKQLTSSTKATNGTKHIHFYESEILKYSRILVILSYDFTSAWNHRKLILSGKRTLLLEDELQLSKLVLSYSPKSECAWNHRRWAIKLIDEQFQNLQEVVEKESELVKEIAEKSKMNYRAWSHRCWLVPFMTKTQVFNELNKSKKWTELHVADNCCFHYRRRLMLRMIDVNFTKQEGEASFEYISGVYFVWKEELKWNELLIKRYIGREALWVHRRFLSQCWIRHYTDIQETEISDCRSTSQSLDDFLQEELHLMRTCLNTSGDEFEDTKTQAQHAASYVLWIAKQLPVEFQDRLRKVEDLKVILMKACPEKTILWDSLLG